VNEAPGCKQCALEWESLGKKIKSVKIGHNLLYKYEGSYLIMKLWGLPLFWITHCIVLCFRWNVHFRKITG